MGETLGILGQAVVATAQSYVDLVTVPAGNEYVIATLMACNQNTVPAKVRVAVRRNSTVDIGTYGVPQNRQCFLVFDLEVPPGESFVVLSRISLGPGSIVTVGADQANVSFNAFGVARF